jgi:hypothetical protein
MARRGRLRVRNCQKIVKCQLLAGRDLADKRFVAQLGAQLGANLLDA